MPKKSYPPKVKTYKITFESGATNYIKSTSMKAAKSQLPKNIRNAIIKIEEFDD